MLELRVYRVGETAWSPPREVPQPDLTLIRPVPLDQLEAQLGWKPHQSRHADATAIAAQWIPAVGDYFADFGPSIAVDYRLGGDKFFTVLERPLLTVHGPCMFIYPPHVSTTEVKLADGTGVIVRPSPEQGVASFSVWTRDDRFVQIIFTWPVSIDDASEILKSLFMG